MDFNLNHIQVVERVDTWQSAIRLAAHPLLVDHIISTAYVEAMIDNVKTHGDYIVLVDGVAMPHARPEQGAFATSIGVLILRQPVIFGDGHPVRLVLALATTSADSHLRLLSTISEIIDDGVKVDRLIGSRSPEDFSHTVDNILSKEGSF